MSRAARLSAILDIVREQPVRNQSELVDHLEQRGISATQATVSRDVRHLGLVKAPGSDGAARYLPRNDANDSTMSLDSLRSVVQSTVTAVKPGGEMLVIKTPAGFANALAVSLDGLRMEEIVGTIAGDDTLLVILRNQRDLERVRSGLQALME